MANQVGTYKVKSLICVIGGVIVDGWADNDYITVKYDQPRTQTREGADGGVGIAVTESRLGTIEITLLQTSTVNDALTALFSDASRRYPFTLSDGSGSSVFTSSDAWIQDTPEANFGTDIKDRRWVLRAANLSAFFGGNS